MKKNLVVITLIILSLTVMESYAHTQDSYDAEFMDEMHGEFVKNIENSELRESFDEMHDICTKAHSGNYKRNV